MNITDRLIALDPTLERHNEGFWNEPYDPQKGGFSSFNDAGVECEVGEFLYSLIRLLKPNRVLETGTHIGVGAAYMGMALKDNNFGTLDTIEFLLELQEQAIKRIQKLELMNRVNIRFGDVKNFEPINFGLGNKDIYQLIFLDTEPQTRFREMVRFSGYLARGGFLFIHDLHRHMGQNSHNPDHPEDPHWPWGAIPEEMRKLVIEQFRPFHFKTPRGLTGFYKTAEEDYIW